MNFRIVKKIFPSENFQKFGTMASCEDCDMAEPVRSLDESGPLVMGPGAKKGIDGAFAGPLSKLTSDENSSVQLAKKYAMEQSIKMVKCMVKVQDGSSMGCRTLGKSSEW